MPIYKRWKHVQEYQRHAKVKEGWKHFHDTVRLMSISKNKIQKQSIDIDQYVKILKGKLGKHNPNHPSTPILKNYISFMKKNHKNIDFGIDNLLIISQKKSRIL